LTPTDGTPEPLVEQEVAFRRKRGRPKKREFAGKAKNVTDGQNHTREKGQTNTSAKQTALFKMLKSLNKNEKIDLLKQLISGSSDDEGPSDNDEDAEQKEVEPMEEPEDIPVDNSFNTHYGASNNNTNIRTNNSYPESDQESENEHYVPRFVATNINMKDKREFDFQAVESIIYQIQRDKCGKMEAQRRICEYMNQFFAVIKNQSHELIMIEKIYKPEFGHCELAEMSINSFKINMSNYEVVYCIPNNKIKVKKLGDFYVESRYRLNYNRMVFNPYPPGHENAASSKDLNMFTGLPFTLEECRECYELPEVRSKMEWIRKEYILKTVSNEDDFAFEVFEQWFGAKIREPWRKLNWMILFFGGFGSGKSTLMKKIIKVIFGSYCKVITDIKQVFGEFDSIKRNALIIMLDENVAPETRQQEAKLTAEITSSFTSFREMYRKTEQTLSFYEYVGGTNPKNKVFLKIGDRRVFVIKTNEVMTLTGHCQIGEETEKVTYWDKVNCYLDDLCVVKAYQYHLHCMLTPNPNIRIGLHAPHSKIKDELLLSQSPDSLSFAKIIITRGYIVPQSRLTDCDPELNKHFTNLQGRICDANGKYDSPWVRELCIKDVEKEFRLLYPHSPMKNNTFWRELCSIFDIKTTDEERIADASKNGNMIMTRWYKNPNIKTKITNTTALKNPTLLKKMVNKSGKFKNKTYYLWPTFYDAYIQFASKTKLIFELNPEAKRLYNRERAARYGSDQIVRPQVVEIQEDRQEEEEEKQTYHSEDENQFSKPVENNNNNNNNNNNKRKRTADMITFEKPLHFVQAKKKRKIVITAEPNSTSKTTTPEQPNVLMEQLKLLMDELKTTKEEFNKTIAMQKVVEEELFRARQPLHIQPQPQPQPQPQSESYPLSLSQPQELHYNTNQVPPPLPQQYSRTGLQQFRPYPDQEIINTYHSDKLHFDSPHQNQETLIDSDFLNNNTNGSMDLVKDDEDEDSNPSILVATPLLEEADPSLVRETYINQTKAPKKINMFKMFDSCKN
jgi:hypothetical protein